MRTQRAPVFLLLPCLFVALGNSLVAQDIVISEIQYHPHLNIAGDEYIELENRGAETVDLSNWYFIDGVFFMIPPGTCLEPGEALVISPDRDRTIQRYGIDESRVVGNYEGRLENSGEILHLGDGDGNSVFRVHYRDRAGWPELADGNGPSLELRPGFWDPYLPDSWRASFRVPGTPGEPTAATAPEAGGRYIFPSGAVWSYFEGVEEPSPDVPLDWTRTDFDDGDWLTGPEPFGFGQEGLGTELPVMQGRNLSLYTRLFFQLPGSELDLIETGRAELTLNVTYDDGFVLYLNGSEMLRANVPGNRGEPVPFDVEAERAERSFRTTVLTGQGSGLEAGTNVFAIQVVNRSLFSGDVLLSATVWLSSETRGETNLRINEAKPDGATQGFIEIYNPDARSRSLAGYSITDSPYRENPYVFQGGSEIAANGLVSVSTGGLPFGIRVTERRFLLLGPGGEIQDAFRSNPSSSERSTIRYPDGSGQLFSTPTPSPAQPNRFTPEERAVINEIHYHPVGPLGSGLEFIEIHNRSDDPLRLEGWRFTAGVRYEFPPDTVVAPRGFLIVAADPRTLEEAYQITGVLGPYRGGLANDAERIDLRDPLGDLADRVPYADDGDWPTEADGMGASLELLHPEIDNLYGTAWRASRPDGTPGEQNGNFSVEIPPQVVAVEHAPAVPSATEEVRVTCRVLDNGPVAQVVLRWTDDSTGAGADVSMNDAGETGDTTAGDGTYSGIIPSQQEDSTIRFVITAIDLNSTNTFPTDGRFFLYEVNSSPRVRSDVAHYTILMTRENWRELRTRGNGVDRLLDGTFVDHPNDRVYYNIGVRYRGNGTRNPPDGRFNYRVQFPDDRKFQGINRLNLNSQNPHRQLLGNDMFRRIGIPYPLTAPVALRFERQVDVQYVRVEAYDEEFLTRFFDFDDEGNLYRGLSGRLRYRGDDPDAYSDRYRKVTNEEEDDYSDLIDLTNTFAIADDETFAREIARRIDISEWILYFTAQGALGNNENSINLDAGDDYFLYARPSDGRFLILPWDSDTVFVNGTQPLFRPSSDAVRRLLRHPDFAPIYYCALDTIQELYMSEEEIGKGLARVATLYPPGALAEISNFLQVRHAFLDANVPRELTLTSETDTRNLIIAPGDDWAYWPGITHPTGGDLSWAQLDFDDVAWPVGPSGFGYGDGDDATLVDDMQNNYPTVFIRKKFRIEDVEDVETLTLWVDYDDGFVAYLNGEEVARRNYDGVVPGNMETASRDREAGSEESFPLGDFIGGLRDGENVLALVAFNGTLDSSDLSLIPSLEIAWAGSSFGCENLLITSQSQVRLSGEAPGCGTWGVRVNGQDVNYEAWLGDWNALVDLEPGTNRLEIQAVDIVGLPHATQTLTVERTSGVVSLPARIFKNHRLAREEGPYLLVGEVIVESGAELEIEAGSLILVGESSRLVVLGRLVIAGNRREPVVFRPSECGLTWEGILLEGANAGKPHRIEGSEFLSGNPANDGFLQVNDGNVEVRDCQFAGITGTVIGGFRSELRLERVEVRSSRRGIVLAESRLDLVDSLLTEIGEDGVVARSGAVSLKGCGISAGAAGVRLTGGNHEILGTLIWRCGSGISLGEEAGLIGDHDTIADNGVGIEASDGFSREVRLSSLIVWGNSTGLSADLPALFDYSDVQGTVRPGSGNISADPLFVDPGSADYRLLAGSPAIGTGEDGSDMGAFPSGGSPALFIRGDSDANGEVNLSDAVGTLLFLFRGAGPVDCPDAADANDDAILNLTDPIHVLNYLFLGGVPPRAPFPEAGVDPTEDALDCPS